MRNVPGSLPISTLRFVDEEEEVSLVIACLVSAAVGADDSFFDVMIDGGVTAEGSVTIGTARASGTPIPTTYRARNAPTNPRPYCTKCWKSPLAPLLPHARSAHYE